MKTIISIIITIILCLASLSCSKKYTTLEKGNYYNILPDNFINKWHVTNDSIIIVKVNFHLPQVGGVGDTIAAVKIYDAVKKGDAYNLYIDQIGNKGSQKQFSILAIQIEKGEILYTTSHRSFPSLVACKDQKFLNPRDVFCFSLYTDSMYNAFQAFDKARDIDTATVCAFIKNIKALFETNKTKVENMSKYDMYLSVSMKELTNRTLIGMRISPTDYTNDELKAIFKKCDNRIKH